MYNAFKTNAAQVKKEVAQESRLNDICALMDSCNWTAKQAMVALKLTIAEQNK